MRNLRENGCNMKVYVFEYNNFKRVIAVLATMCLFIAGLLLIIEIPNIFTVLIGIIIIFWSFLKSLDISTFERAGNKQ
jgi:hypothetical protein